MPIARVPRQFAQLILLTICLILAPSLAHAKIEAPIVSSFQLLTSPTLGGECQVIWAGVPEITPLSAGMIFKLTTPDGRATTSTQPLTLTQGRASDLTFTFPVTVPGTYQVGAALFMTTPGGHFSKIASLNIVIPATGKAHLAPEKILDARQFEARTPTKKALALLRSAAAQATASQGFAVTGTYRFTNKLFDTTGFTGTRLDPIRRATVEIFETDGGQTTTSMGFTQTAEDGSFTINVPPRRQPRARPQPFDPPLLGQRRRPGAGS